ncbi:MAG: TraB/GumN family protein [Nanoarchaeota archaeon]
MSLQNLHIIGTSHIAKESVTQIEEFMDKKDINLVCVELDRNRLFALKHDIKGRIKVTNLSLIGQIGLTGFIFALIAQHAQKKMGETVKTKAGSDMLAAVSSAGKRKIPIALIDQDVNITLRNLSRKVPFSEKMRILVDLFKGMLGMKSELTDIDLKKMDLNKVPPEAIVEKVLSKTKHRYPKMYDVLVEDRNRHMVNKIVRILETHPDWNLLVVIGAGHKEGIVSLLEQKTNEKYSESSISSDRKSHSKDSGNAYTKSSSQDYRYSHSVKYK